MAKHDLLSVLGLESLKTQLDQKPLKSWGRMDQGIEDRALRFSESLGEKVLELFMEHNSFLKSHPILLGSWARGELTPGSDLDLLFLGPENEVREVVGWAQSKGLKIRSRVPEDFNDLSKGVQLWDLFSLLDGKALTDQGAEILKREQEKILQASLKQKRQWVKQLLVERKQRHERFDSIENLLQPQMKMGLGGLRDLHQARILARLFPEIAKVSPHSEEIFSFFLRAFLWIRILLHLHGESDLLSNAIQPAIAERLGFKNYHTLMDFVQKGLSRVSFYSDWMLEASSQPLKVKKPANLKKPSDAGALLRKDPSVLNQYEVRRNLDRLWSEKSMTKRGRERGQEILKFFPAKVGEEEWIALFRSRLMDRLLPQLNHLIGHVQHDQYHRYTADAHVLQVVRQVLRSRKSPRILGALAPFAKELSSKDWNLLIWTALYHDLAKGQPADHSELGEKWVRKDLKSYSVSKSDIEEVAWLVRYHLEFSQAGLRRDPQDARVLSELSKLGLTQGRIRRLLIFTAIDIRGTNPDSWNDWKAKLLADLGHRLLSKDRQVQVRLFEEIKGLDQGLQSSLLEIGQEIGLKNLRSDLIKVRERQEPSFDFFKQKNRLWVRYHQPLDQKGTLSRILGLLFQSGASVLKSSVMTLPELGVYDWFCLEEAGRVESLKKRLEILALQKEAVPPKVVWEKVDLVSKDSDSWTLLFKGMDQRGLLWDAARRLFEAGAEIKSAHVQTWGKKAEDLFVIKAPAESSDLWMEKLKSGLVSEGS